MEVGAQPNPADSVEFVLRDELAAGDAAIATFTPILHHLLDNGENSVFSDEVVAGVRGMASDVAGQLLDELARLAGETEKNGRDAAEINALTAAIVASPAFLGHVHALAIEWQTNQRLHSRLAIDPVLSPLLQSLMASPDPDASGLAMKLMAAQARFCQSQRRMKLPLTELPGDLLQGVLQAMRTLAGADAGSQAAAAEAAIRSRFDEDSSRLGLIARLVTGMGGSAGAALSVSDAGAGIFLTALAFASGQDRDLAVLSTGEQQLARLALALRASGLKHQPLVEQFLAFHPDAQLPQGFDRIGSDRAAALLAGANLPDRG